MTKPARAGMAALLAAPLIAFVAIALVPTVSDDADEVVRAFTDHRVDMILGLTLQTIALVLLIGGAVWLAWALHRFAPRLALVGGVLAVAGSLIPLFENGVDAAKASIVSTLDPNQAVTTIEHIHSSALSTVLGPLSLFGDLGLALLAVAAVKAGAPRWAAASIIVGSFGEGIGFGAGARPLVLASFAILFVGFAGVSRFVARTEEVAATGDTLVAESAPRVLPR